MISCPRGHDGGIIGFKTFAYTSPGGNRQAVIVYNDYKKSVPPPAGVGTAAGATASGQVTGDLASKLRQDGLAGQAGAGLEF